MLSPIAGNQGCMDTPEAKDFDPTIHTAEYVAIEHDESFAQIRDKVEDALARTPNVILVIPRGTTAFHTTQDFLALGKIQWRREVRVAVATPDPTIAGLARVLGFHIVEPPADHPALAGDPGLDNGTGSEDEGGTIEKPTSPLPLGGLPGMPEWVISPTIPGSTYTPKVSTSGNLTTSTWLNMPGDGMGASPSLAADAFKPAARSGQPPPRRRPRQTGHLLPTQLPDLAPDPALDQDYGDAQPETGDEAKARLAVLDSKAYRSGRGWRYGGSLRQGRLGRVLVAVAVVLVLSLVAASSYAYVYLPEGVISVVPQSKTITDLTVRITVATGQPNPLGTPDGSSSIEPSEPGSNVISAQSLAALTITQTLTEESTAPSTGTRQIPTGQAQGVLHFINNAEQTKFVPEGTEFTAANGVVFKTTQAGTVPAANVLAQVFGLLDLPVVASVEGPDGNLSVGDLSGYYGNVRYINNTPINGGSLQTVNVVTQEDIDNLRADLMSRVEARVNGAISEAALAMPGQKLIAGSTHLENPTVEVNHQAGEDGDSVTVKVTGVAVAYTYDEAEMADQVRQAVYDYVQSNEPANYGPVTDLNSITLSDPVLQPSGGGAQGLVLYAVTASAHVKYTLTPVLAGQIRTLVKGKNVREVPGIVSRQYGSYVAVGNIQSRVLWFNIDKLPDDATRIEIQQSGAASNNTATLPLSGAQPGSDQR